MKEQRKREIERNTKREREKCNQRESMMGIKKKRRKERKE